MEVAIKVLPATLSADKERLLRLEQEAQTAGALNHPNILVIHYIDIHDGSSSLKIPSSGSIFGFCHYRAQSARLPHSCRPNSMKLTRSSHRTVGSLLTSRMNRAARRFMWRPFPAAGKWQISTNGGDQPQWRRDGKEIFYVAPDKTLMAVSVTAGNSFENESPVALFATRIANGGLTGDRNRYIVAADGQRFLVSNVLDEEAKPLTVVLNWNAGSNR